MYTPLNVDFNITNICNLKCKFCYSKTYQERKHLTLEEAEKILSNLSRGKIIKVHVSGGEPFLNPQFIDILKIIKGYKLRYSISTNGTIFNDVIFQSLENYPPEFVGISHPSNSISESKERGNYNLFRLINGNIQRMLNYNINLSIGFTITKTNLNSIIDSIIQLEKLGIKNFGLQYICPVDKESELTIPDIDSYSQFFNKLTDYIKNGQIKSRIMLNTTNESPVPWEAYLPLRDRINDLKDIWGYGINIENGDSVISCTAGKYSCAIDVDGYVYECEMFFPYKNMSIGNIFQNEISYIWKNKKELKVSKPLLNGKCSTCEIKFCNGGCRAAALYYKDINFSDMRCPIGD